MHTYLQTLQTHLNTGSATEHTHRPALQALLETLLPAGSQIINEPRRAGSNAVDFELRRDGLAFGWIEAKDIGANLDKVQDSEQLLRYRDALHNLILTDYLEFRYFYNGELQADATVRIGTLCDGQLQPDDQQMPSLQALLMRFYLAEAITLNKPPDLAERMAKIARLIAYSILQEYATENHSGNFHQQIESFRTVLLDSLAPEAFADMYAQTVCYGLFAAKCTLLSARLSRFNAAHSIPKTNPFLRNLFDQIAGINMDERLTWAVEHLIEMLNRADIGSILADFGKRTRQEDPVVHFYETFLAAYDPNLREVRGVYYTPEPVVSYIVRSVDAVLKSHFHLKDGLACKDKADNALHKVQILDPATGTGTFLYALFNLIHERFLNKQGIWRSYVSEHLLPRIHGFELLMAPYTVAHMKLGLQLQDSGYEFESHERLRLFLSNSLEDVHTNTQTLMARWLSEESNAAHQIKSSTPVMVILGNPPYSGHSANPSKRGKTFTFIGHLIQDYFSIEGQPLNEQNPKWLQDDYVKFIRFAQWKIEQTGYGIVGFVTNHGYLDNPTFRGMRHALMRSFDEIYILDLHGNSKKKEKAPDGSADHNVFDIQQGVAIGIFIKHQQSANPPALASVFHAELWGKRSGKYAWLNAKALHTTDWTALTPDAPFYLFKPQNTDLREEYNAGWKITEIMPVNSVGIVTARDSLTIQASPRAVQSVIQNFVSLDAERARDKYHLGKDTRDWQVKLAQEDLKASNTDKQHIHSILYRPFDVRYTYYTGRSRGFICMPRPETMQHLQNKNKENQALITVRQVAEGIFNHVFSTNTLADFRTTLSNKGGSYYFPLYLYPTDADHFINGNGNGSGLYKKIQRKPNFSERFIAELEKRLGLSFLPEAQNTSVEGFSAADIFNYIYAILHSSIYRRRYADFLKEYFPRVPLISDVALFAQLAAVGQQLVRIHLMQEDLAETVCYPVDGSNRVDQLIYQDERIYINKRSIFPVAVATWEFYIGGYQVAHKWLKDRKGKTLDSDDIDQYFYLLAAVQKNIELIANIDELVPEFPLP